MDKFKYIIQIVLFGFLILKESSLNPLQNEKKCSSSSQAKNDQFSYIVLIRVHSNGEILCQGTLIDVNWVLTSAYCINTTNNIPLNNIDIAIRNNKTHTTILKPKKVIETKNNDVALLKIEKSIITNSMIKPIKLATEDLLNNTECVVISLQKQLNNDLSLIYWNVVNILKQKYDKSEWYLEDTICHSQIWNSLQNTTDNGTPLICNNQLYGIYSFNEPNIFNNIIKYNNWIKNLINPTSLDTASEKYMTNFVSNHNSISDTNSTVTEFNTNNISSPEYVYKKTYSKPVSTSFVYTQKERKSITMDVEYNSLSTEPTIMKDMDIIKFVYNNSNSPEEIAEIEKTTVKKISYETEETSETEDTTETVEETAETAETEKTTETSEILSDTTESVDLTSLKSPTQSYSSTTIIKSSTTEKSDLNLSPMTYITIDTDYLEYTEKNKDNEESSDNSSSESSTIQSSTTENFTSSSNPSIIITGKTDEPNATKNIEVTEITWGTSSSESSTEESESIINSDYIKETEYTKTIMYNEETDYISDISSELSTPVTPVTQDTSIKVSTLNPKPSTAKSEETIDPDDTEDPYSKMPSTHRPITQSSTTKVSTLSTSPSTVISEETEETEDDRLIETIRTTVIDGTKQTSQTETSVTYSSTITTIIPPNITTNQSSPESNTTLSDHGDEPNTTTTTTTPTTTSIRTVVIYDISDPREFSTFVDDQYQDKSSSQITSIHTSLIIIVFYIMYHTNL